MRVSSKNKKEVGNMRKILIIMFFAVLSVALVCGTASAAVSGKCSNCHTMHNSQQGLNETKDFNGQLTSTAQGHLTKSSCLGCHNGVITGSGAPNIFGTYPTGSTAGGSFANSNFSVDSHGHNVKDLNDASVLTVGLETDNTTATPGNGGDSGLTVGLQELTCAGTKGCHGDHTKAGSDAGIRGFHHGSKDGYRYLQASDGTPIVSKGSDDWELGGADASNHNVYSAGTTNDTISALCNACHGEFHGSTETKDSLGTTWVRHPTEELLPADWNETGNEVNIDYNANPFAFQPTEYASMTTSTDYSTIAFGTLKPAVACVSCHRAHATDQPDILRFSYTSQDAGSGSTSSTGCLGCHTKQR